MATCVDIEATDIKSMVQFSKDNAIDLVVVTPDDPGLRNGGCHGRGRYKSIWAQKDAALIESSKVFARTL